jgi:hypothetical protein
MFCFFILNRLNEVDVYSAISLKQRSTCRHVIYIDTISYVILDHKQNKKDWGTKDERMSLLFSHHIYEGVKGELQRFRGSWMLFSHHIYEGVIGELQRVRASWMLFSHHIYEGVIGELQRFRASWKLKIVECCLFT